MHDLCRAAAGDWWGHGVYEGGVDDSAACSRQGAAVKSAATLPVGGEMCGGASEGEGLGGVPARVSIIPLPVKVLQERTL